MNLINEISHRPWPIPSENWILRQSWSNFLFLHWPISSRFLQSHIPSSLQIDTFDGSAWLSVVAFTMEGIYFRGLPMVSLTPKFAEVNVRTYVQCNGKPGVYFMSLDVGDWASLRIAKRWFRLPYHSSQISLQKDGKTFQCQSIRKEKSKIPIAFEGKYTPRPDIYVAKKETFDNWITERYCFFSLDKSSKLYCSEIHHQPWSLQKVDTEIYHNTLFSPFELDLSENKPLAHFSKGLDTLFWNIKRIGSNLR